MSSVIYDDLLGEYLDENGKILKGTPTVKSHSYGGEYKIKRIIKKNGGTENENNKH